MGAETPADGIEQQILHSKDLDILDESKKELNDLGLDVANSVQMESMKLWQGKPGEMRDGVVDRCYGKGMISRMQGLKLQTSVQVTAARDILKTSLKERDQSTKDRVRMIIATLLAEPPSYGNPPDANKHMYVSHSELDAMDPKAKGPLQLYKMDKNAIQADITLLRDLQSQYEKLNDPAASKALKNLANALQAYAYLDPEAALQYYADKLVGASYTSAAFGEMGRVGAIGLLGGASILFGTMAAVDYFNKPESERNIAVFTTPALYAFATWAIKDNIIGKIFFQAEHQECADQFTSFTDSTWFEKLCVNHSIGGKKWMKVVRLVHGGAANNIESDSTDEEKKALAKSLAGKDATIEQELMKMIDTQAYEGLTEFDVFIDQLKRVTDEEAQKLCQMYIEKNAFTYGAKVDPTHGAYFRALQQQQAQAKAGGNAPAVVVPPAPSFGTGPSATPRVSPVPVPATPPPVAARPQPGPAPAVGSPNVAQVNPATPLQPNAAPSVQPSSIHQQRMDALNDVRLNTARPRFNPTQLVGGKEILRDMAGLGQPRITAAALKLGLNDTATTSFSVIDGKIANTYFGDTLSINTNHPENVQKVITQWNGQDATVDNVQHMCADMSQAVQISALRLFTPEENATVNVCDASGSFMRLVNGKMMGAASLDSVYLKNKELIEKYYPGKKLTIFFAAKKDQTIDEIFMSEDPLCRTRLPEESHPASVQKLFEELRKEGAGGVGYSNINAVAWGNQGYFPARIVEALRKESGQK